MASSKNWISLTLTTAVLVLMGFGCSKAMRPEWCPFPDSIPETVCYCQLKFGVYRYMYCDNLGNMTQIPSLVPKDVIFKEFHIKGKTTLEKIQANSFQGNES